MNKRITYLLGQYGKSELTPAETAELKLLFQNDPEGELIKESLQQMMQEATPATNLDEEHWKQLAMQLLQADKISNKEIELITPVRRLPLQRRWIWAAASLVIAIAAGSYAWMQRGKITQQATVIQVPKATAPDVAPGKQGAILQLADGTQVVLDSLGNGVVAVQNGTQLVLKNGQLTYDPTGKSSEVPMYNTMSTPRGRQFRLSLPDSSQVWLNAGSSITYPTFFTGATRQVIVKGEAYFEIAKNPKMPFIVSINDKAKVEVLGTHFNINAYDEEASIQTTLLEGKIKMVAGQQNALLFPGQQASIKNLLSSNNRIELSKDVDIEKIMAWKDGLFNFEGLKLGEVMRQLSRWYDINVTYQAGIPDLQFVGEMSRNISLSGVLKGLQGAGVHFKIEEGRRLVVLP
ncbi:MAG: FecR domain-containing protein [Ferruginibacter sp.]